MPMDSNGSRFPRFSEHKVGKNRHFIEALHYAREGIRYAFQSERNLRIEGGLFLLALIAGGIVHFARWEWAVLLVTAMIVFGAEFTNTLIEWVCDLYVGDYYNRQVKHIKDAAAGLVTLMSIGAGIVGAVLFLPHIWLWFVN